jgi:hypothetical protein
LMRFVTQKPCWHILHAVGSFEPARHQHAISPYLSTNPDVLLLTAPCSLSRSCNGRSTARSQTSRRVRSWPSFRRWTTTQMVQFATKSLPKRGRLRSLKTRLPKACAPWLRRKRSHAGPHSPPPYSWIVACVCSAAGGVCSTPAEYKSTYAPITARPSIETPSIIEIVGLHAVDAV